MLEALSSKLGSYSSIRKHFQELQQGIPRGFYPVLRISGPAYLPSYDFSIVPLPN